MNDIKFIEDMQEVLEKYKEILTIAEITVALDYLRNRAQMKHYSQLERIGETNNG